MKTFTNLAHWASKCASLGTSNRNRYYLFSIIMLFTFGIGNVWGAEEEVVYTLTPTDGSNNSYTGNCDITIDGITWNLTGNSQMNPWRIGGKNLSEVDRALYSKNPIPRNVTKIVVTHGTTNLTVNSCSLVVSDEANGTGTTIPFTFTASSEITITLPDGDNSNKYFKFIYNVTAGSSNKYLQFSKAEFYGTIDESAPTLSSIAISGDLTNKTYEEGQELDLTGLTVTGTYSDASTQDVTADVEWSYNPLTQGQTSVTITATYEEQTADITITGLTVNEHIVTPGTYDILINNVLWDINTEGSISSESLSGKSNDISFYTTKGSSQIYTNAAQTRFYTNSTLTISVPSGYVIKSIVFAEPSSSKTWNGSITVDKGTYTDDSKSWAGNAQEVVFSFGAQNRIATATITYAADVKYTLNITTPANGTLVVKEGETALTSGTEVSPGTSLTVIPTPADGYLFESLTVGSESVNLTDGKYTFTMPESDVTVTATFKENEAPDATLTLSINGNTDTKINGKQDDIVTLPSTIENDCSKTFVGWSANPTCAVAPEYAPGAEYTLTAEEQTLYAVYADATIEGTEQWQITKDDLKILDSSQSSAYLKYAGDQEKDGITFNIANVMPGTGDNSEKIQVRASTGTIYNKTAMPGDIISVVIDGVDLSVYEGTEVISSTPSTGAITKSSDTYNFSSGNRYFHLKKASSGAGYASSITVTYESAPTYSNYSTTCSAALEAPAFSLAEGTYNEIKNVTLSATEGDIYYTLDGTTPTAASTKYTAAIVLDECGETTIKAIAISADSQSPVAEATYTIQLPIPANSAEDPYTTDEAIDVYDGGCYNGEDLVYVTGTVQTAQFYSSGSYTITLTDGFQFYKFFKDASQTQFADGDINAGDVLVACGKLDKYYTTYQLAENCYLVSHIPYEGEKTDISNTEATAYTIAKAIELYDDVTSDLTKQVYVTGIVSEIVTAYNSTYGNISYNISDDGTTTSAQLQAYRGKSYDGENFTSADDIQVGDEVVVYGLLDKYNTIYQLGENNQLVSLVRPEQPEPEVSVATLPFAFDGKQADIANTLGMSHEGIDAGDYASSPHLKFNTTGDYLIIHFDSEPDKLSYDIKGNSFSGGTFTVQESADGETYTAIATYTELGATASEEKELTSTSRYVKFIYTTKSSGNVALGNIKITVPGSEEPTVTITSLAQLKEQSEGTYNFTLTDAIATYVKDDNKKVYIQDATTGMYIYNVTSHGLAVGNKYSGSMSGTLTVYNNLNELTAFELGDDVTSSSQTITATELTISELLDNFARYESVRVKISGTVTEAFSSNNATISDGTNTITVRDDNYNSLTATVGQTVTIVGYPGLFNTNKQIKVMSTNDWVVESEEPGEGEGGETSDETAFATFIFNTAEGIADLGITYPATVDGTALKTDLENNATFTQNGVSMTVTGGTNTATRVWLTASGNLDLRIYKGATMTFSVADGLEITKIVFNGSSIANLSVDGTRLDGTTKTWTGSENEITFNLEGGANINTIALTIAYTRSVTAGNLGTICLPYGSSNYSGATFYEIAYMEMNGSDPKCIYLDEVANGTLEAGKPYIFQANNAKIAVVYEGNAASLQEGKCGLTGVLDTSDEVHGVSGEENALTGNYIISGTKFYTCGTGCSIYLNRAYIDASIIANHTTPVAEIPGRRRIAMGAASENQATGLDNLTENGTIAPAMEGIYDIMGRKLTEPTTTGFYIINGKKVFVVK